LGDLEIILSAANWYRYYHIVTGAVGNWTNATPFHHSCFQVSRVREQNANTHTNYKMPIHIQVTQNK